jgi:hypothetical protein
MAATAKWDVAENQYLSHSNAAIAPPKFQHQQFFFFGRAVTLSTSWTKASSFSREFRSGGLHFRLPSFSTSRISTTHSYFDFWKGSSTTGLTRAVAMPHAVTMASTGLQALIFCGPGSSFPTFTANPDENPKALLPIANRPMVWYPIEFCYRMGVTSTYPLCFTTLHIAMRVGLGILP